MEKDYIDKFKDFIDIDKMSTTRGYLIGLLSMIFCGIIGGGVLGMLSPRYCDHIEEYARLSQNLFNASIPIALLIIISLCLIPIKSKKGGWFNKLLTALMFLSGMALCIFVTFGTIYTLQSLQFLNP